MTDIELPENQCIYNYYMGGGASDIFRIPLPISLNMKRYFEVTTTHTNHERDHYLYILSTNDNSNVRNSENNVYYNNIFQIFDRTYCHFGSGLDYTETYVQTSISDKNVVENWGSYIKQYGVQLDFINNKVVYTNLSSNTSLTVENKFEIVKGMKHYLYFFRDGGNSPLYLTLNFQNTEEHPFINTNTDTNSGYGLFDSGYKIYEENKNGGNAYAPLKS